MKTKNLILASILFIIIIFIVFAFAGKKQTPKLSSKLQVTTSIYPMYFLANQIGGDKVNVTNITPAGAEPHDYEPTSQDLVNIESSNLLVLNGAIEPWAPKIKDTLKGKKVMIITAGENLFTENSKDSNGNVTVDPHIWLNPKLAEKETDAILSGYISADSVNKTYYEENASKLKTSLENLDNAYKTGLANCQYNEIITSHSAFTYLAKEYNLKEVSIAGLSPDAEPSLRQLSDIATFAKDHQIKYIFFESLVSPKLSETLANEIGAKTLVLNPIEGLTPAQSNNGSDYLTLMQDNLQNLKVALNCK